jgi:hypothetical protein
MTRVHLHRAVAVVSSKATFSVLETGLSAVYPVRLGTADIHGWLTEPGYPPTRDAFGRMRGALTAAMCLAMRRGRTLEVAAGGGGLTAALAQAGQEVVANDLRETELRASLGLYDFGNERVTVVGGNVFDLRSDDIGALIWSSPAKSLDVLHIRIACSNISRSSCHLADESF